MLTSGINCKTLLYELILKLQCCSLCLCIYMRKLTQYHYKKPRVLKYHPNNKAFQNTTTFQFSGSKIPPPLCVNVIPLVKPLRSCQFLSYSEIILRQPYPKPDCVSFPSSQPWRRRPHPPRSAVARGGSGSSATTP